MKDNICRAQAPALKVTEGSTCPYYEAGQSLRFSENFPGHCPSLLHMIHPYLLTYTHGGFFPWMRNKDHVVIACSGDAANCIARLERSTENRINFLVTKVKGACPYYSANERYAIDAQNQCMKLAALSLSYADRKNGTRFRCPGGCGSLTAEIVR